MGPELAVLFAKFSGLRCSLNDRFKLLHAHRLGEEITRAELHRFDRLFDRSLTCEENNFRIGIVLFDFLKELDAALHFDGFDVRF